MGNEQIPAPIAAQKAGVSREVLVRAVQRRELDGRCIDGRWVVSAASLAEFIQDRRADQGGATP